MRGARLGAVDGPANRGLAWAATGSSGSAASCWRPPTALRRQSCAAGLPPRPPSLEGKPADLTAWAVRSAEVRDQLQAAKWGCSQVTPSGTSVPVGARIRTTEAPWYLSRPARPGSAGNRRTLLIRRDGRVGDGRSQGGRQLGAGTDGQLPVDVAQVAFHGVERHEHRLRYLGVAHPARSQLGYPALAGGQRLKPGEGGPPRPGPRSPKLLRCSLGEAPGTAAVREVEPSAQLLARCGALVCAPQRRAELDQRAGVLKACAAPRQYAGGLAQV